MLGLRSTVETDHKPLVPSITSTELIEVPVKIQRFRLRLMRYSPEVKHIPGKYQATADALSRLTVAKRHKPLVPSITSTNLLKFL